MHGRHKFSKPNTVVVLEYGRILPLWFGLCWANKMINYWYVAELSLLLACCLSKMWEESFFLLPSLAATGRHWILQLLLTSRTNILRCAVLSSWCSFFSSFKFCWCCTTSSVMLLLETTKTPEEQEEALLSSSREEDDDGCWSSHRSILALS